jgi:hypothetical protein
VVDLGGIKLSQIASFNQYLVGFDNPSYPQNYPQKLSGNYYYLAPDVRDILAEVGNFTIFLADE